MAQMIDSNPVQPKLEPVTAGLFQVAWTFAGMAALRFGLEVQALDAVLRLVEARQRRPGPGAR